MDDLGTHGGRCQRVRVILADDTEHPHDERQPDTGEERDRGAAAATEHRRVGPDRATSPDPDRRATVGTAHPRGHRRCPPRPGAGRPVVDRSAAVGQRGAGPDAIGAVGARPDGVGTVGADGSDESGGAHGALRCSGVWDRAGVVVGVRTSIRCSMH
jgi:hypothetical protein